DVRAAGRAARSSGGGRGVAARAGADRRQRDDPAQGGRDGAARRPGGRRGPGGRGEHDPAGRGPAGRLQHGRDRRAGGAGRGRRGEMPMRPAYLPPRGAVIDLVYVEGGTTLVRRARQLGVRCVDGWSILLAQGAAAFQAWTSLPAPLDAMRSALPEGSPSPPE